MILVPYSIKRRQIEGIKMKQRFKIHWKAMKMGDKRA